MAEKYTADFETTTDPEDCRVWAWGIASIEDPDQAVLGYDLDGFIEYTSQELHNPVLYIHNIKFDADFLLVWLFEHGFRHVQDKDQMGNKTFTTLISDLGQFYAMTIVFEKTKKRTRKIEILDSYKIIPLSVAKIPGAFGLKDSKLEIDYHKPRPPGYRPDADEQAYIVADVQIVARALSVLFDQGLDKMTTGSNALADYKKTVTWQRFNKLFPPPDYDPEIRKSYRGGFTWMNPKYKGVDVGPGIVLDVNSLYPAVMYQDPLPYGNGIPFDGKYPGGNLYNLYVQNLTCHFKLKPGHIPTIQIKRNFNFVQTEYLESSQGLDVKLCLTSVDLKLFLDHYDVYNIVWEGGWKFKSKVGMFKDYIDKWTQVKIQAQKEGNKGMRTLAKLMLNSLYGKFALNPDVRSKIPVYDNGLIRYPLGPKETRKPLYIPVGTFITAYARDRTIRAGQAVYKRFIYADTDSLHLEGTDIPDQLDIDPSRLGAWGHEMTFQKARFLHAKTYIEYGREPGEDKDQLKITCSGMPQACHKAVSWENFRPGMKFPGKLVPKHVPGGTVLVDVDFTISK